MAKEKYVAYVSTYTIGDSHGIRVYDVDMEKGRFLEKDKVEITNSSYVTVSHNGKCLYSITDFAWTWNASLSYQFLRDRSATVSLKAFDILGQRSNVQRTVTANYIDDALYNSLTRYFMVSVSYKFNTFGKGKMPEDRNAPRFGDGPPPGAPRPPRGAGGPPKGGHGPF